MLVPVGDELDVDVIDLHELANRKREPKTFEAEDSDTAYGSEWDFSISKKLFDRFTLSRAYATYSRDKFAADIERFWATVSFKY